ncbi:MAG: hypothetical protein QXW70_00185 [Candidatus Anstonellales archaeon]
MGNKKKRGRERLLNCSSCGRRVPRDKAVQFDRTLIFSTDMKTKDDVKVLSRVSNNYCPSCAKAMRIYEKKKEILRKRRQLRESRRHFRQSFGQQSTYPKNQESGQPHFSKISQ